MRMSRRLIFSITFLLLMALSHSAVIPEISSAQESSGEEVVAADASPDAGGDGGGAVEQTGFLQVIAYTCETTEEASVSLYSTDVFSPDDSCYQDYADVLIDGIDYGPAAPMLEIELNVGVHGVSEVSTGGYLDVEVFADAYSGVAVVSTISVVAATETSTAQPETTGDVEDGAATTIPLRLVMHRCDADIQNLDAFWAKGSVLDRLIACPVMTRPDEYQPDGSVTGGQEWFDVAVATDDGSQYSLTDAQFKPASICESEVGVRLTNNPYDDGCLGQSGFEMQITPGVVTVTQTAYPDFARFGYAETVSDASGSSLQSVDPGAGIVTLDLTGIGAEGIELHLYDFTPAKVTVVVHSCGPEVSSAADLEAAGGFLQRRVMCPADYRTADGGSVPFDLNLTDGYGAFWPVSTAIVGTTSACEFDMGIEFNDVADDNACLTDPSYTFFDVGVGYSTVALALDDEFELAMVEAVPGSGDELTLSNVDTGASLVQFDTTSDGSVVWHIYRVQSASTQPIPPTFTPTATASPTPSQTATPTPTPNLPGPPSTGAVQVVALFCLGDRDQTVISALSPGAVAGAGALGGSCFAGDTTVSLHGDDGSVMGPLRLGTDGIKTIDSLAGGGYSISEHLTGASESLQVDPKTVTRVIIRFEVALSSGDSVTAASGSSGSGSGSAPANSPANPLDQLTGLVTDELGGKATDTISFGSASDPNFFVADLLGDVDAQKVSSISTASALPGVGTGNTNAQRNTRFLLFMMAMLLLAAASFLSIDIAPSKVRMKQRRHRKRGTSFDE